MHWTFNLIIPANLAHQTVRDCLRAWLIPKRIQGQLRQNRRIWLNGTTASVASPVNLGDQLRLDFVPSDFRTPVSSYLPDTSRVVDILFQNHDLLVVNKPAGIKSHPNQPGEVGTLLNFLAAMLPKETGAPYMIHRLDQMTSGAMIVALNPVVVPILDRLISEKQIHRTYLAWVRGHFDSPTGHFTAPIGRNQKDKRKRWVNTPDAQPALTDYQVLQTTAHQSLVQLELQTGRTHQLRVHLAASQHPIIGDPLYDAQAANAPRLLLHAIKIHLVLPFEGRQVSVVAPRPAVFDQPDEIETF